MKYYEIRKTNSYYTYYNKKGECVSYYDADDEYIGIKDEVEIVAKFAKMKDAKKYLADQKDLIDIYTRTRYSMHKVELL